MTLRTLALVAACSLVLSGLPGTQGRKLAQTYESSGDWGSTSTTRDPATGASQSTTNVNNPYYQGSFTTSTAADGSTVTTTPSGTYTGRKLSQTYESSGDWGSSSTTVDPATGASQTTTNVDNPYYQGSFSSSTGPDGTTTTSPSGTTTTQGRKLSQTYESSGDWGSTSTTRDPATGASQSTTNVNNPYYQGTFTTSTAADGSTVTTTPSGTYTGRKLSQTYESSGDWGSTSTTRDPATGASQSTTNVNNPYYQGTFTTSTAADGSTVTTTPSGTYTGRKLSQLDPASLVALPELPSNLVSAGNVEPVVKVLNAENTGNTETGR